MTAITRAAAFLCFDVDGDETAGSEFFTQFNNGTLSLTIEDSSAKAMRPRDDWDKLVRGKIGRCSLMIVLVGKGTCSSEEVAREIRFAKGANVPFFGIYLEGGDEVSCLKLGLPPNRIVHYDWKHIASAVDQLLTEGKNHTFV